MSEIQPSRVSKQKIRINLCARCEEDFEAANAGIRICPKCRREKKEIYAARERHKRSLPFYLKTDM